MVKFYVKKSQREALCWRKRSETIQELENASIGVGNNGHSEYKEFHGLSEVQSLFSLAALENLFSDIDELLEARQFLYAIQRRLGNALHVNCSCIYIRPHIIMDVEMRKWFCPVSRLNGAASRKTFLNILQFRLTHVQGM